ncbi:hypothetical protein J6590_057142 [Homalodisca vitripennis]|nr:hypothetical protein J6590_057142 [Homalodisca vitripennis]
MELIEFEQVSMIMPDFRRSSGFMVHPVMVWYTSCCLCVQYRYFYFMYEMLVSTEDPVHLKSTIKLISKLCLPSCFNYGNGSGSCSSISDLKGSKASIARIQRDIVVPRFLDKNAPILVNGCLSGDNRERYGCQALGQELTQKNFFPLLNIPSTPVMEISSEHLLNLWYIL